MSNQTSQYTMGVISIISRAKIYNPEIGDYVKHVVNRDFNFAVQLSNGRLVMSDDTAHDMELGLHFVSDETIKNIANTFTLNKI